jgi:prepilin-type N-terminal cleavage/methylation domain-containing protein/prepilin-type processing-associated H-X9-DG protein
MTSRSACPRRGFTFIELLVVIGILAVLSGLILAAVQRARESARRAECQDRMKNQGLAVFSYESVHGQLPPGAVQGPFAAAGVPDGASHSLWALLLPHLDQAALASHYRLDLPWDDPANQPVVTIQLKLLVCPNAPANRIAEWTNGEGAVADYAPFEVNPFLADIGLIDAVSNFQGPMPVNGMVQVLDITDGTSNTVLLAEASGRPGVAWSSPQILLGLRQFFGGSGGLHPHGSNVCMADGSVHFLHDSLDLRELGRLATRAGGEVVSGSDF